MRLFIAVCLLFSAPVLSLVPCDSSIEPYARAWCLAEQGKKADALFIMHSVVKTDSLSLGKCRFYLSLLVACDDRIGLRSYTPIFYQRFIDSLDVVVECAHAFAAYGNWKQAVSLLEKQYGKRKNFGYLPVLAGIYFDGKQYDQASSVAARILRTDSTYAPAYFLLGNIALKTGLIERLKTRKARSDLIQDAVIQYRKAVFYDTANIAYLTEIAVLYDSLDQWDSTCFFYTRALERDPANMSLLFSFGKRLKDKGMATVALELFERAFLLDSMNVSLLQAIEAAHKAQGTNEEYYLTGQERMANALPDSLSLRYNLALEYIAHDMPEKAIISFRKLEARNSSFEFMNRGMAAIFLKRGECDSAIPYLQKQVRATPLEYNDAYNLALCLLQRNDTVAALKAYEQVLKANPRHAPTAFFIGTYYYNKKDYEHCLRVLVPLVSYDDQTAVARMRGGSLFYLNRDARQAVEELSQCVGTAEDDEILHYMLAGLYERLGEKKKAVAEYEKCMAMNNGANAEFYRNKIRELE